MAVRSRQFGPFALPVAAAVLYTVPADRTMLIETITYYNATGSSLNIGLAIRVSGTDYYFKRITGMATSTSSFDNYERLILNPGHSLVGFSSVVNAWITVSGSLLLGAPT